MRQKLHHKEYICYYCSKEFRTQRGLNWHVLKTHRETF